MISEYRKNLACLSILYQAYCQLQVLMKELTQTSPTDAPECQNSW